MEVGGRDEGKGRKERPRLGGVGVVGSVRQYESCLKEVLDPQVRRRSWSR
jgi:hypothetical protein